MNALTQRTSRRYALLPLFTLTVLATGCAGQRGLFGTVGPDYTLPKLALPNAWTEAAKPASPATGAVPVAPAQTSLAQFWSAFDDPILMTLIDAVQKASPDIVAARVRIDEAKAALGAVSALELPDLNLNASATRSKVAFFGPATLREQTEIGLRSSWEIDLFGGVARQSQAAAARLQGSQLQWHDARVSVAAATASAYFGYRQCEAQAQLLQSEVDSRAKSAAALRAAGEAGLKARALVLQEEALLADFQRLLRQKQTNCAAQIKALVALSQTDESAVRSILASRPELTARLPVPPAFKVDAIPADLLMQRPDVRAAERNLAAASADIGASKSRLYPSLTLTGSVAPTRIKFGETPATNVRTWSIGPSVNLPIFNRNRIQADVDAATSRYQGFEAQFRSKAFDAVREVEQSLLKVDSTADEMVQADLAVARYQQQLELEQARLSSGLSSELDFELNRRALLRSQMARLDTQLDRLNAWITLYRSLGGNWSAQGNAATPS